MAATKCPRISIILPTLNAEKYVRQTVETVLMQSFSEWELIVQDAKSTDGTLDILHSFRDRRIRIVSEPDLGQMDAFFRGFQRAQGDYWMLLCASDGYIDPDWLRTCVEILDSDPHVSLVWGIPQNCFPDGMLGELCRTHSAFIHPRAMAQVQKERWFLLWIQTGAGFPDGNMCIRSEVLRTLWPLKRSKRSANCFPTFFTLFNLSGLLPYGVPRVVNYARFHPGQLGMDNLVADRMLLSDQSRTRMRYARLLATGKARHCFRDGTGKILSLLADPRDNPEIAEILQVALQDPTPLEMHFSAALSLTNPAPIFE